MGCEELTNERGHRRVVSGDLVIEFVERNLVRVEDVGGIVSGLALKRPVLVVIRSPAGTFRFDLEAADVEDDGDRGAGDGLIGGCDGCAA